MARFGRSFPMRRTFRTPPKTSNVFLQAFTATLTPAGVLAKNTIRSFTAALTSSGSLTKKAIRAFTASITPSGVLTTTKVAVIAFTASITPSGALTRKALKSLTASLTPSGSIAKRITHAFTASITPAGALAKKAIRSFTASITPTGSLARRLGKNFTASLTPTGAITKRAGKALAASLTPTGAISKSIRRAFTAAATFAGNLAQSLSGAKTYYVSATGSDANNGTSAATPWQTIAKVNATTLVAGDTVLFKGGDTFSGNVTINQAGTSSNPITFNSYGTGYATISNTTANAISSSNKGGIAIKNLIITGGATAKTNGSGGIVLFANDLATHDYILIDNVTISQFSNGVAIGSATGASKFNNVTVQNSTFHDNRDTGLLTYGQDAFTGANYCVTNITVTNCTAYDNKGNSSNTTTNSGNGIVLGRAQTGLIDLCVAYGNGTLCPCATEGPVGLWCYNADSIVIQRSVSYNNSTANIPDGDGFDLDINVTNSTVQYCIAYGNMGAGILCYGNSTGNTVRYNITWGNGTNPIGTPFGEFAIGSASGAGSIAVYNNTFISRDATTNPAVVDISGTITGVTMRNNIFYAGTGKIVKAGNAYTTSQVFMQNNDYYRAAGTEIKWGATTHTTLEAWRTAVAGQEQISGVNVGFTVDPVLHNASATPTVTVPTDLTGAYNYKLQDTSTLIGHGTNLNAVFGTSVGVRDFFNTTLTTVFDLGASIAHYVTPSIFTPIAVAVSSFTNRITGKAGKNRTTDTSGTNVATAHGSDTIRGISAETNTDTLDGQSNQTEI